MEALLARKEQGGTGQTSRRERSTSFVSSACSQAPSEFFAQEEFRLLADASSDCHSYAQYSHLEVPKTKISSAGQVRRYARSAEPYVSPDLLANARRPPGEADPHAQPPYNQFGSCNPLHRRAASLTSIAESSLHPKRSLSISNRIGKLYPSLDKLAVELRPIKSMPIKGRAIAAAVSKYERITEVNSKEHLRSRMLKRKASDDTMTQEEASKRVRI